jgi:L-seryl-tRNA(Ser) seleniumtransferase
MLGATRHELDGRARSFAARLRDAVGEERDVSIEIVEGESVVGGGSAPAEGRPTMLLALRHSAISADAIEGKLRMAETPVIARIENDAVLIDLRTVRVDEEDMLLDALKSALVG